MEIEYVSKNAVLKLIETTLVDLKDEESNKAMRGLISKLCTTTRRKGKWVRLESGADGCNQCWSNDVDWGRFPFCPVCGAEMRKGVVLLSGRIEGGEEEQDETDEILQ